MSLTDLDQQKAIDTGEPFNATAPMCVMVFDSDGNTKKDYTLEVLSPEQRAKRFNYKA